MSDEIKLVEENSLETDNNTKEENNHIIKFENATISQGKVVLSDVNLEINKGEFVYLIGKTGTGKSSLLKTIYADLPLTNGFGEVCDMPILKIKKRKIPYLRRKIGIVFQDFQLLQDRNLYKNLEFVLKAIGVKDKSEIESKINLALENVGLLDKKFDKPYNMSEGEMQRVAIARAIVNQPELIIGDEPTGNLDPITSEDIIKLLLKINKEHNTTILMATHDYLVIEKYRSRVICCEDGKLIG
ncbi:MAG: ATP-binding cassette domain-containing protein [Bacteroidales bacterium]